jgi:signal transduction histidine kinase
MRFFTTIFTLLLLYTVAALLFWGVSLQRQSRIIYTIELSDLRYQIDSAKQPAQYNQRLFDLTDRFQKRKQQYYGEGGTLLFILLMGASVVYTSLQRKTRLQRQQTNFMLAVTHELKSPIAGMKLSIQTLQRHQLSEEQRAQLLGRCIQEADRLSDLCNNMLITSQIEGQQYKTIKERLSLSDLVSDSAGIFAARYPGRISLDIVEHCMIVGDMLLLQMAVSNLLENAIKYTPADTPIAVSLTKSDEELLLQVADTGNGIPDSEKKKIFSKFYRIGDEATRHTKGTGLGLYLTRQIVQQHKGRIAVRDNTPSGAIFQISLPCS